MKGANIEHPKVTVTIKTVGVDGKIRLIRRYLGEAEEVAACF